jgi:hypothetical protein
LRIWDKTRRFAGVETYPLLTGIDRYLTISDIMLIPPMTRPAMNPATGQPDLVLVIYDPRINGTLKRKDEANSHILLHTLPETLREPDAIFKGLRAERCGGLCYAKHTARRYPNWLTRLRRLAEEDGLVATPEHQIFLAYVSDNGIVYRWGWEKADKYALMNGVYLPNDHENRFSERLY